MDFIPLYINTALAALWLTAAFFALRAVLNIRRIDDLYSSADIVKCNLNINASLRLCALTILVLVPAHTYRHMYNSSNSATPVEDTCSIEEKE